MIFLLNLLAKDGTAYNERQGLLGRLLHDITKWAIRRSVHGIAKKLKPVTDYKMKTGWINPEVGLLYDDLTWLIRMDENGGKDHIGGFTGGENDANRRFFTDLRDIVTTILDEDTHYNIRFWVLQHRIHENRWNEAYNIAFNRSNAFFNYRQIYQDLISRWEPLPKLEDMPEITGIDDLDELDEEED